MGQTYTPSYYSSLHDTITSICKNILPFSFKNRRLTSNRHSDSLKWQQESFHKILNLIVLHKEGIVPEIEVIAFRTQMLETLIASPAETELPGVIRDKLLFLQDLFYAKCISEREYHRSKRPLIQRLAVQGVEINSRDVIAGDKAGDDSTEEEWSVIDLRDKDEITPVTEAKKSKHRSSSLKGAMSFIGFSSKSKGKNQKSENIIPNHNKGMILIPVVQEKGLKEEEKLKISNSKKQWGFDGLKKWKRNAHEESAIGCLVQTDDVLTIQSEHVSNLAGGQEPETKRIKKKMDLDGSSSDLCNTTNPICDSRSTGLSDDTADPKKFFSISWCDVEKNQERNTIGKKKTTNSEKIWVRFEDENDENDENFHPNLFSKNNMPSQTKYNPFDDEIHSVDDISSHGSAKKNPFQDTQNPFWASTGC